jgi:hypothetical protein
VWRVRRMQSRHVLGGARSVFLWLVHSLLFHEGRAAYSSVGMATPRTGRVTPGSFMFVRRFGHTSKPSRWGSRAHSTRRPSALRDQGNEVQRCGMGRG